MTKITLAAIGLLFVPSFAMAQSKSPLESDFAELAAASQLEQAALKRFVDEVAKADQENTKLKAAALAEKTHAVALAAYWASWVRAEVRARPAQDGTAPSPNIDP